MSDERASEPLRSQKPRPESSRRVLVVDDNDDNRDLFVRRLRRKGFEVVAKGDGPSALACLETESFDCVVLDWMMPNMSGLEVLDAIRERYTKVQLPVLMATAKRESDAIVEALAHGANDHVSKPIDFPVLIARLETQLSVKHESASRSGPVIDMREGVPPGTVLDGRYEIGEQIGEGGFAAVYRAKQLSTGQRVAFKLLLPHRLRRARADVEVARFLREMKVIAELEHPHVVRLVDSGQLEILHDPVPVRSDSAPPSSGAPHSGETRVEAACSGSYPSAESESSTENEVGAVPYIVMEFLDGEPLADYLVRKHRLETHHAVDLILPIISALGAAHRRGIVHRDVKPHNILLVKDHRGERQAKVLDFGIAKLTGPDSDELTRSESFIGTPEFMAPEQARGKRTIDGRADQFSVAAIAYLAITGHKLYVAESLFEMIHKVATGAMKAPSELGVDLHPGLEAVILKALSTQPNDRYPSIEAFGRALLPHASEVSQKRWEESLSEAKSIFASHEALPAVQPLDADDDETDDDEGDEGDAPLISEPEVPRAERITAIDGLLRSTGDRPLPRDDDKTVEESVSPPSQNDVANLDVDAEESEGGLARAQPWLVLILFAISILIALLLR